MEDHLGVESTICCHYVSSQQKSISKRWLSVNQERVRIWHQIQHVHWMYVTLHFCTSSWSFKPWILGPPLDTELSMSFAMPAAAPIVSKNGKQQVDCWTWPFNSKRTAKEKTFFNPIVANVPKRLQILDSDYTKNWKLYSKSRHVILIKTCHKFSFGFVNAICTHKINFRFFLLLPNQTTPLIAVAIFQEESKFHSNKLTPGQIKRGQ